MTATKSQKDWRKEKRLERRGKEAGRIGRDHGRGASRRARVMKTTYPLH